MPIRDATARHSIEMHSIGIHRIEMHSAGIHRIGIHSAGAHSAETPEHTVQGAHRLVGIRNPPQHPYETGRYGG